MNQEARRDAILFLERKIIGSLLNASNSNHIPRLPEHIFNWPSHRAIIRAINACQRGDLPSVVAQLVENNDIGVAGGADKLSEVMDSAPSYDPNNIDLWTKQLREYAKDVELLRQHRIAGEQLQQGDEPSQILKTLSKTTQDVLSRADGNPLVSSSLTAQALMDDPPLKPNFLLGDLIPRGSLNLMSAIPGAGKSWLCLQLAACLSTGRDFLLWRTRPSTTAYIGFEIPNFTGHERLTSIQNIIDCDLSRIHLLLPPSAPHLDLSKPQDVEDLRDFCIALKLDFLILDPLKRFHTWDENSNTDMGLLIDVCDDIRKSTDTAIFLSHHESTKTDQKGRADVDSARGASVLSSHPTLIMRIVQKNKYLQLRVAKSSFAQAPKPIWLEHTDTGYLEISDGPKKSEDELEENVAAVLACNKEMLMKEEVMELLPNPRKGGQALKKIMEAAGYERIRGRGNTPFKKVSTGVEAHEESEYGEGDFDF